MIRVPTGVAVFPKELSHPPREWAERSYNLQRWTQMPRGGHFAGHLGLAAWIVEKFRTWSDCDGDVERSFSKDELLTNITIYWANRG